MEQKTKRKLYGVGALFIAVIFIFSYAAFSNNGGVPTSTTTVGSANTIYVYGTANGIVVNYSYTAFITTANKIQLAKLNDTLGALEDNGTISNFVPINSTSYEAILSTISTYQLYAYLSSSLNYTSVSVGGIAYVRLPATISMHYGGALSSVPITFPPKNYTMYLQRTVPINSTIQIEVRALITQTGAIYDNQVLLTQVQG